MKPLAEIIKDIVNKIRQKCAICNGLGFVINADGSRQICSCRNGGKK